MSEPLDLQQFRDLMERVRDGRKVGYEQALLSSLAACVGEIERITRDRDSYANSGFERQLDEARVEVERLRALCEEACRLADEGWGYAGDYFRDKWQCDERLAAIRAASLVQK